MFCKGATLKPIRHAARLQGNGTTLSGSATSRRQVPDNIPHAESKRPLCIGARSARMACPPGMAPAHPRTLQPLRDQRPARRLPPSNRWGDAVPSPRHGACGGDGCGSTPTPRRYAGSAAVSRVPGSANESPSPRRHSHGATDGAASRSAPAPWRRPVRSRHEALISVARPHGRSPPSTDPAAPTHRDSASCCCIKHRANELRTSCLMKYPYDSACGSASLEVRSSHTAPDTCSILSCQFRAEDTIRQYTYGRSER